MDFTLALMSVFRRTAGETYYQRRLSPGVYVSLFFDDDPALMVFSFSQDLNSTSNTNTDNNHTTSITI